MICQLYDLKISYLIILTLSVFHDIKMTHLLDKTALWDGNDLL